MKISIAFCLAAALCACSAPAMVYAPSGAPSAVLPKTGLPPLYLEKVDDETDHGELYVHHGEGEISDTAGAAYDPGVAWGRSVRDALMLELTRVGWPATAKSPRGCFRLKAAVTQARADWTTGFNGRMDGNIRIKLILKNPEGKEIWRGGLEGGGDGPVSMEGSQEPGILMAWNEALAAALGRLGPMLAASRPWESHPGAGPAGIGQAWWSKDK